MKPLEVEILVAELDPEGDEHQLYHIAYDGTVVDEEHFTVLGGEADLIAGRVGEDLMGLPPLSRALRVCVDALGGPERQLAANELEVAVLAKSNGRRAFHRLEGVELEELLATAETG